MQKNRYYTILLVLIGLVGCKEQDLLIYDTEVSGSNIYFLEPLEQRKDIVRDVSFGYAGASVRDSIIQIPIGISGVPVDKDRTYRVETTEETSMELGVHYEFVDENPMIRANRVTDTLRIRLFRAADIAESKVFLGLHLVANENFGVTLPFSYVNSQRYYSVLKFGISSDDIAGIPFIWTATTNPTNLRTTTINYLGAYSKKKVELMIDVLGIDPQLIYTPPLTGNFNQDYLPIWSSYMKYWLGKEKAEGRIYYDENNVVIAMGRYAS
ncbi:DUF4843 domain-containing protein [uncultured Sphingobacterium sp.]|uniref:DUF4843 domain-containing protein n=1 Tax=uncultured Sphingobacterium sp. TaxID=182688 RepID=UPI0025E7990E|nr:DUF4843 domain-containing protein [uncultured Sphingobacterium sp.]